MNKPNAVLDLEQFEGQCKHPAKRLFAWHVGKILCVACCKCGAVLQGGAK